MKINFRTVESIRDDLEAVQQRIAARASEIFRDRGRAIGNALDDWLDAERETVWRPAIEVRRTKDAFVVTAAVAGVESKQFDVRVTPTELLLTAELHHVDRGKDGEVVMCEFANGPLFRTYRFPEPIDPAGVTAEYHNGLLVVTAPRVATGTKVEVKAA